MKTRFFPSKPQKEYDLWLCQKVCDALYYLVDNIFIRFSYKLYRQIVGIPMGTYCAHRQLYLFKLVQVVPLLLQVWFCFVMREASFFNQAVVSETFSPTSRYHDDFLNADNP